MDDMIFCCIAINSDPEHEKQLSVSALEAAARDAGKKRFGTWPNPGLAYASHGNGLGHLTTKVENIRIERHLDSQSILATERC